MTTPYEALLYAREHNLVSEAPQVIRQALKAALDFAKGIDGGKGSRITTYRDAAVLLGLLRGVEPHARGVEALAVEQAIEMVTSARLSALNNRGN
jgi:hypothetical protein